MKRQLRYTTAYNNIGGRNRVWNFVLFCVGHAQACSTVLRFCRDPVRMLYGGDGFDYFCFIFSLSRHNALLLRFGCTPAWRGAIRVLTLHWLVASPETTMQLILLLLTLTLNYESLQGPVHRQEVLSASTNNLHIYDFPTVCSFSSSSRTLYASHRFPQYKSIRFTSCPTVCPHL